MLLELLVPLVIPSDNVLVTLDTQGPNAINVQAFTIIQVVFVKVSEIFKEIPLQSTIEYFIDCI